MSLTYTGLNRPFVAEAETVRNNEHTGARRAPCNASGCLPEAG